MSFDFNRNNDWDRGQKQEFPIQTLSNVMLELRELHEQKLEDAQYAYNNLQIADREQWDDVTKYILHYREAVAEASGIFQAMRVVDKMISATVA